MKYQSISHEKYSDPFRILALAVIKTAKNDALGQNVTSSRNEVMADALAFFVDGRYAHIAVALGLNPAVLPPEIEELLNEQRNNEMEPGAF